MSLEQKIIRFNLECSADLNFCEVQLPYGHGVFQHVRVMSAGLFYQAVHKTGSVRDPKSLLSFFLQHTSASEDQAGLMSAYAFWLFSSVHSATAVDTCMEVRVREPCNRYDVPRWHVDSFTKGRSLVLTAALQGPSTLFKQVEPDLKLAIRSSKYLSDEEGGIALRQRNDDILRNVDTQQASAGRAMLFGDGTPDTGALHSEPPFHTARILVLISATKPDSTIP